MTRVNERRRRVGTAKYVLGIAFVVLLAIACWLFGPGLVPFFTSSGVVDQGHRGLIILSSGAGATYTVHTKGHAMEDGTYRFVFYFTAPGITYGETGNTTQVPFHVTFAGAAMQKGITCGAVGKTPTRSNYAGLPAPAQGAVFADSEGGTASATDYSQTSHKTTVQTSTKRTYGAFTGSLWLLDDSKSYSDRYVHGGATWAESCTLPEAAVWRYTGVGALARTGTLSQAAQKTLLPPQMNWTPMDASVSDASAVDYSIEVDRSAGTELSEGYPAPVAQASDWYYDAAVNFSPDSDQLAYSDQPVYIFTNRNIQDEKALLLLILGALVGGVGAFCVKLASETVDRIFIR